MKKLMFLAAFLLLTINVLADEHNNPVPSEGTMTATVIMPLTGIAPTANLTFDVIRGQFRTLTADNRWEFIIKGEPGRKVQVNFFAPVPFPDPEAVGYPALSGKWYGPDNQQIPNGSDVFELKEPNGGFPVDSFFDIFFVLESIDAGGATTLGAKTFKLEINYQYDGI